MQGAVRDVVQRLLVTDYAPHIEAAVRAAINQEVLAKIIQAATDRTMQMLKDRD